MSIQLTKEQMQELGIAGYTDSQREALMMKIGKRVFDAAIVALIETLNEEQLYALNHAIDTLDSFDAVIAYLQKTYPAFESLVMGAENSFIEQYIDNIAQIGNT